MNRLPDPPGESENPESNSYFTIGYQQKKARVIGVGENEVIRLEIKMAEMENRIIQEISAVSLDMAKHYVPKKDCEKHREEELTNKQAGVSNVLMGVGIFVSLVIGIINLLQK